MHQKIFERRFTICHSKEKKAQTLFTNDSDVVVMRNGDTELNALGGDDVVELPQAGVDGMFSGSGGDDNITGGRLADEISGGSGEDMLFGQNQTFFTVKIVESLRYVPRDLNVLYLILPYRNFLCIIQ